jgi:hypothetical protein
MNKSLLSFLLLILFTASVLAQQNAGFGSLTGKIRDQRSGDELIGANVLLVDTKLGASTDIDGRYTVRQVPAGTYSIRVSFLGYESKTVSGIIIADNQQYILDVAIAEDQGIVQQEVVISASAIKSGEGAILAERKKAASIGDGISAEQIKRAPDATSSDALKRVTGVTIVDNKFVFVRGVTDRYNQTTLNGASVTSTSVDKKSFSFDMIPSNLVENMNVTKTATPDLPGDFTGGLVQLNTLDFPDSRTIKFVYGASVNSITTFNEFNRSQGGKSDWIGIDDGIRRFPGEIDPEKETSKLGSALPNTWAPRQTTAPLNQSMSISYADIFPFEESQFGVLAAISYRNNFQRTDFTLNDYSALFLKRDIVGTEDKLGILWGGIFDLNVKIADMHKLTLKNNFNKSTEDKYIVSSGNDFTNDQYTKTYLNEWDERTMVSNQLGGEHKLTEVGGIGIDWLLFFSQSLTEQPDKKQVDYNLSRGYPDSDPYSVNTQFTKRAWGRLYDRALGQKLNIVIPVGSLKLKTGIHNEFKNRNYNIQYFQPEFLLLSDYGILLYDIDSIFAANNFGVGKFSYGNRTQPSDRYSAKQQITSLYAMADVPFSVLSLDFRFTGGLRFEKSAQYVTTSVSTSVADQMTSLIDKKDILPSANLTYIIDEVQNFRVAYSHTVNRPEFREQSNVLAYDFDKFEEVQGNPNLTRAYARNYDVRYEIFPDIGDLFAVSYFYKSISHPIEERRTFLSFTTRTWENAPLAFNRGYEVELRKHFGFIDEYLRNMQLIANYTRIYSEVSYKEPSGATGFVEGTRAMQGQSPYLYNISLFYTEPSLGTSVNILYNEYGSRINAIGQLGNGDFNVVEERRGTVDFSLTQSLQTLMQGLEMKYTVKNLNNQPVVFTHGENTYRTNYIGINHSLQLNVNF